MSIGAIQYGRDLQGRAVLKFNNAQNVEVKGFGNVSGDGELKLGSTGLENADYTQFTFSHEGDSESLLVLGNDTNGKHFNITGENINVKSEGGNAERTIQVDAINSNIDLTNANGSHVVNMTEKAQDNKVTLGSGSDLYIDGGKFNHATATGGSNEFQTTADSWGSVIVGGAGSDTFTIYGKYGVIDGGNGKNTFKAMGLFGETENSSYRNILLGGDGDDTFTDKGGANIFFDSAGNNTAETFGVKTIAQIGSNNGTSAGIYGSSADKTYIFAGETLTNEKTGTTYTVYDIMNQYGWTLHEFLYVYSQISPENPDSIGNHDVIDDATMKKLQTYFANNLQK